MKNTYAIIIVLILLAAGAVFLFGKGNKVQAPESNTSVPTDNESKGGIDVSVGVSIAPVKEFTVTGKNFAFSPSLITVKKGDKVKITFKNENGFHDFVIDEFGAATKQTQSPTTEVIEFTADKTGSFEYYCSVGTHRAMGMKGTLVVES